jgi:hypothetical protein
MGLFMHMDFNETVLEHLTSVFAKCPPIVGGEKKKTNLQVLSCCIIIASTSGRLHSEFVRLLFLQAHRETDRFFAASGVQLPETQRGMFHFHHASFSAQLKSKVDSTLTKATVLRININIDGTPITSRTHTHPSHSQTSRLLTSSLSLGVPVPRTTQSM